MFGHSVPALIPQMNSFVAYHINKDFMRYSVVGNLADGSKTRSALEVSKTLVKVERLNLLRFVFSFSGCALIAILRLIKY
jgi:hypothetical protein